MKMRLSTNVKFKRMFVNTLSIFVVLVMAFPATGIVSAQEPAPFIRISTSNDYLQADNFTPNAMVTFTVYASQDSSDVVLEISRQADQAGLVFIDGWEHSADLVAGNYVIATDGTIEKRLVLQPLTMEVFDPVTDLITGTATPGQAVWVLAGNNIIGYPGGMWVEADPNGLWTADFSSMFDFTDEMWGGAVIYDEDGDFTVYHLGPTPPPPAPWLIAFPENDAVEGWEWRNGATVTLTIDNAPGLSWSGTAAVTTWGDPRTYVRFEFWGDYNLQVGDMVTLTDEFGTSTTHEVQPLSITGVDKDTDIVAGTANVGAQVQVWAHAQSKPPVDVTASDGTWQADLTDAYDITYGTDGRAWIIADGGNATAVDWHSPNPHYQVQLETNHVDGWEWMPNGQVTININGMEAATVPTDEWGTFRSSFEELEPFVPGMDFVITDGVNTKTLTTAYLEITNIDPDADTISGRAHAGQTFNVWVHRPENTPTVQVTADTRGQWTADFSGQWDIMPGNDGAAQIDDEDGDGTWVPWRLLNPRMIVFPEWEFFDGNDWPDGAVVNITVASKPECATSRESWDNFFNGNFGEGCNVETGDLVTFTDGSTTRTHTVQNLAVTNVDVLANTVGGTAAPGAVVDVWPHETGQQLQATAADGNWQVDFTRLFDLVPGTCGRSQILVGVNATAVDWCAPRPWLMAFPENDAVEGWEWPVGTTVTLTIDNAPEGFERSGVAEVTTWGDPRTFIRFDFADAYDLKIGDTVTLTGEDGATRTHVVQNLSVTDLSADADTVTGTANAGAIVTLWPHGHDQIATIQTTADDANAWSVDFATVGFNLVPGIGGRSEVGDEAGNWTAVDWNVPMDAWQQVNDSGFGNPQTAGVTALEVFHSQLFAGASNGNAGGEVWRLGQEGQWLQVSGDGFGSGSVNPAIIDLAIFQGKLYAGSGWNNEAPGQVWRSADGTNWQPVTTDGFGVGENIAVTNFVIYKGMLYAGTGSVSGSAQIWRSSTGDSGSWTQVAPDEPGLVGNVTGFADYKGVLYTALEPASGAGEPMQVWRSTNGSDWTTITDFGFGESSNESTGGFAQFGGYLYLGTRNEATGAQLWRTLDGLNWEQVVGNGFGDLNNIKIESLLVYDDLLYAATYNSAMGLQLWRSADGLDWEQVTANGFGDSSNFSTLWNSAVTEFQGEMLIGTWNNAEGGELWMYTP